MERRRGERGRFGGLSGSCAVGVEGGALIVEVGSERVKEVLEKRLQERVEAALRTVVREVVGVQVGRDGGLIVDRVRCGRSRRSEGRQRWPVTWRHWCQPSARDLARVMGTGSTATVHYWLVALEAEGVITRVPGVVRIARVVGY